MKKKKHIEDEIVPIKKLQEDLKNPDPHFRQNSVIGFAKYFENEEARKKLKEEEKTLIVNHLIQCLEPKEENIEVKARTVKVFKSICIHLKEAEIIQVFNSIVDFIINKEATGKDIFVNCLKGILEKVPGSFYETIGKIIIPKLTEKLEENDDPENIILYLDTINEYIKTFDYELIRKKYNKSFTIDEKKIINFAIKCITSPNDLLKVTSIEIIGTVGELLTKNQVEETTKKIIGLIKDSTTILEKKNYILALKSLGQTSSRAQTEILEEIMKLLISFTSKDFIESEGEYDEKNDLVEAALNSIEIYIGTALSNIKEKIPNIIDNAIELLKYDPCNTNTAENNMDIEGYENYEDVDVEANVDDTAWKVRRAAARILEIILSSGFNLTKDPKEKIISALIESFKEQEENTKLQIINCLNKYLDSLVVKTVNDGKLTFGKTHSSIVNTFIPKVAKQLIEVLLKDLEGNSNVVKNNTLKILPTLAKVTPQGVVGNFNLLKGGIDKACFDSNENTLTFMIFLKTLFLKMDAPEENKDIYQVLIGYLKKGIENSYYKVCTAAIEAAANLFQVLMMDEDANKIYITDLYNAILPKFKAQDIDFEIKIASGEAIKSFIINCGVLLSEKEIKELFNIYISKTSNEMIRPDILKVLNEILLEADTLEFDESIKELNQPILKLLDSASPQIQSKILTLYETIFTKYPKALQKSIEEIAEKLLSLKMQEGVISQIFNIFKNMIPLFKETLIKKILEYIENKFSEQVMDNSFLVSIFDFTRLACNKIPKGNLVEKVKKYSSKIKELNENLSYYLSIIICNSGEEQTFLDNSFNALNSSKDVKQTENLLQLMGNVCENSKLNHDDLSEKLEGLKSKLGNKFNDLISEIVGKIGINNPIGFVNKFLTKKQDQDSRVALREFLHLINIKKVNITDANIQGLIDWLLNTPKLEDEQTNKYVGGCIGLVVSLNKPLIVKYIDLIKETQGFKKSSLLNGAREIIKSKTKLDDQLLDSLVKIIIEGIKDKERLIKEHSMEALDSLQYNYKNKLLQLYLEDNIRKIIHESCKTDNTYMKVADFGGGNKIVEDKGVGIRRAALDIETFMINSFNHKIIYAEIIPLLIDCLLDIDDNLQSIVYSDILKLAKLNSMAFLPFGGQFIDILFKVWDTLKIEESKRNFSINVKNIFEALKDVESVTGNPRYNLVVIEINKH